MIQQFIEEGQKSIKNAFSCCESEIIVDKCPKHKSEAVKFMCTHPKCHQILCNLCLSSHKQLHKSNNLRQMPLTLLTDISRIYTRSNLQSQLAQIQHRQQQNHQKPQQFITNCIEQLLYGTTQRREKQLKVNLEQMKGGDVTKTGLLIKMVEEDNEYSVKNGSYGEFKVRYFTFLDHLMEDIHAGKYE